MEGPEIQLLMVAGVLLMFCLPAVFPAYLPGPGKPNPQTATQTLTCPQTCQCSYENLTAACAFSFSDYSLESLLPWQLTKLHIHGNDKTWNSNYASVTVKNVLLRGKEQLKQGAKHAFMSTFLKLEYLNISYIPIQMISKSDFTELPLLKTLKLSYDNISSVEGKAFHGLKKLENLNLDGNKLSTFATHLFSELKSLKNLHLRSNGLTLLRKEHLEGLYQLELLNLQDNMLSQLETFVPDLNISTLKVLDVRGNRIMYLLPETVDKLMTLDSVDLSNNRLQCSCALEFFLKAYKNNTSIYTGEVLCDGPSELKGVNIRDVDISSLSCDSASVIAVSPDRDILYQSDMVLDCTVAGDKPLAVYWITPWGETYAKQSSYELFSDSITNIKTDETFFEINLLVTSRVFISGNGSLVIKKFRGHFAGKFTCYAENLIGSSNMSVTIGISSAIHENYVSSLVIGAIVSSGMIVMAIITGMTRLLVNKCLHSARCSCCCCNMHDADMEIVKKVITANGNIEVTYANKTVIEFGGRDNNTLEYVEVESCQSPPHPPVNSPMYCVSPDKCPTPNSEPMDPVKEEGSYQHIWKQLEEVRARLRTGAGRKIKKVKSQVQSFTDTGNGKWKYSLYFLLDYFI